MSNSEDQADPDSDAATHVSNRFVGGDARVTDATRLNQANERDLVGDGSEVLEERAANKDVDGAGKTVPSIVGEERALANERLGDFRLIRQIGQGGMGVVYEAEQLSLNRRVAVKVLPFAAMLDPQHRKRFQNEARAAATLAHPNIVPVFFVGQERGVHFFAMQLIEGRSLAQVIVSLRGEGSESPLPVRGDAGRSEESGKAGVHALAPQMQPKGCTPTTDNFQSTISTQRSGDPMAFSLSAARLGAEAAEALEHAHQVGILHRDIKPGNLLVDEVGKLWVADFGLATIEHDDSLTRTGGVVGTAAYMSPEQASDSQAIDGRSDVYSLGATLYELLTLSRHRSDEETRLSTSSVREPELITRIKVDSAIPADLETIVIKALSFDPVDRYQSSQAMAADLRSFIAGREIQARRLTLVQRQARWLRRHRGFTTAVTAASFLLLAAFGIAMLVNSRQLSRHGKELAAALAEAEDQRKYAGMQAEMAGRQRDLANESEQRALASELSAKESELLARRMSYRSDVQRAYEKSSMNNLFAAKQSLAKHIPESGSVDLRGVEWRLLNAEVSAKLTLLGSHDGPATECVLFPDGKTVASAGEDGVVHIWDSVERREIKAFDPKIRAIHALAISPDGKTLAVGGSPSIGFFSIAQVHLLDAATGKPMGLVQHHKTTIESIRFSPDGKLLAAGSRYEEVGLSTVDGELLHKFPAERRNYAIAFSPDSKHLVTSGKKSNHVSIWNCQTGVAVFDPIVMPKSVKSFKWSPNGKYLLVSCGGAFGTYVVDIETGKFQSRLGVKRPFPRSSNTICLSPDGQIIVAGDTDGAIHQWRPDPDGWSKIADLDDENSLFAPDIVPITADDGGITSIVCMNDGSVVSTHENGRVNLCNPTETAAQIFALDLDVMDAAVTSGSSVFLGSADGSLSEFVFESANHKLLTAPTGTRIRAIATSADGSTLGAVYDSSRVELTNLESGKVIWSEPGSYTGEDPQFYLALSDDARYLARTGSDNMLVIWERESKRSILEKQFPGKGSAIALSRDAQLVAHGQEGIQLFRVASGGGVYKSRTETVLSFQFSSDGKGLVCGHSDGSIRLIDIESAETQIFRGRAREFASVVFCENGSTILGGEFNGSRRSIQLWDRATGELYGEIEIPIQQDKQAFWPDSKIFAIDDRIIFCGTRNCTNAVAVWDLAP